MNDIIATDNNENESICSKCGGVCCTRIPGEYTPADFDNSWDKVLEKIEEGEVSFDWYDNYKEYLNDGYYLRPKTTVADELFDPSWGGACIMWDSMTGCKLPFNERPTGCRLLEPREDGECHSDFSKLDAANAWEPFHERIEELRYS